VEEGRILVAILLVPRPFKWVFDAHFVVLAIDELIILCFFEDAVGWVEVEVRGIHIFKGMHDVKGLSVGSKVDAAPPGRSRRADFKASPINTASAAELYHISIKRAKHKLFSCKAVKAPKNALAHRSHSLTFHTKSINQKLHRVPVHRTFHCQEM
jgi:hypothetical protein